MLLARENGGNWLRIVSGVCTRKTSSSLTHAASMYTSTWLGLGLGLGSGLGLGLEGHTSTGARVMGAAAGGAEGGSERRASSSGSLGSGSGESTKSDLVRGDVAEIEGRYRGDIGEI